MYTTLYSHPEEHSYGVCFCVWRQGFWLGCIDKWPRECQRRNLQKSPSLESAGGEYPDTVLGLPHLCFSDHPQVSDSVTHRFHLQWGTQWPHREGLRPCDSHMKAWGNRSWLQETSTPLWLLRFQEIWLERQHSQNCTITNHAARVFWASLGFTMPPPPHFPILVMYKPQELNRANSKATHSLTLLFLNKHKWHKFLKPQYTKTQNTRILTDEKRRYFKCIRAGGE